MIKFILGRSGSGKTARILKEISEYSKKNTDGMLLLVPNARSHSMERMLCENCGDDISLYAEAVTFSRMCRQVAMQAGGLNAKKLDDGARLLFTRQAISDVEGEFKCLKAVSLSAEFTDTCLNFIDLARQSGLSPEELMQESENFPKTLADKLHDISLLYAGYEHAITSSRIDGEGEMSKLLSDLDRVDYFAGRHVFIDGFSGFTGVQYKILSKIFHRAESVTVSLCADLNDTTPAFSKTNRTYLRLKAMAGKVSETEILSGNTRTQVPALIHSEKNLFCQGKAEVCADSNGVYLFECDNIYRECELAASEILRLVREEGYRFRDISVSVRNVDEYRSSLETVFEYYGVPLYTAKKTPVTEKAPVALVVSALRIISSGFAYDEVIRYVKNSFNTIPSRACDILEEYLGIWNIKGGEWTREKPFVRHPLGIGNTEDEYSARILKLINKMRDKIRTPLINLRDAMRNDPTGMGRARAIFDFLDEIRLAKRLEVRAEKMREQEKIQQAEEYAKLWNVLCGALSSIANALPECEFTDDEFMRLFTLVLNKYSVSTIPTALDRVSLGDLSRPGVVGNVRVQIILGANEGVMPSGVASGSLFTESETRMLQDAGIELVAENTSKLEEEFRLIYSAFTSPTEKLIVTYALNDQKGEASRPAQVYTTLCDMFNITPTFASEEYVRRSAINTCFDTAVSGGEEWESAREWFGAQDEYREKLNRAREKSAVKRSPIKDEENIRGIFGTQIRLSASRADVYASCRYKYFLQYGLNLRERANGKLNAPEIGTLVHYILENTLREIEKLGGTRKVDEYETGEIARKWADTYVRERMGGTDDKSPRFKFALNHMINTAVRVAQDIRDELNISSFKPIAYELKIGGRDGEIPGVELGNDKISLKLGGVIDRVDAMETEDGKLCVRVVDYKTGAKEFNIKDVLNGVNIQLLVYMFALEEHGEKLYGKPILPAGVLYVPARNPEIEIKSTDSLEQIEAKRLSKILRSGVLINEREIIDKMEHGIEKKAKYLPISLDKIGKLDSKASVLSRDDFRVLKEHINKTLLDMAENLSAGDIRANPCYKGNDHACTYCPYKRACMFDERAGDQERNLYQIRPKDVFNKKSGGDE